MSWHFFFPGGKRRHGGGRGSGWATTGVEYGRFGSVLRTVMSGLVVFIDFLLEDHAVGGGRHGHWVSQEGPRKRFRESIGSSETSPASPSRGEMRECGTPRRECNLLYGQQALSEVAIPRANPSASARVYDREGTRGKQFTSTRDGKISGEIGRYFLFINPEGSFHQGTPPAGVHANCGRALVTNNIV